MSSLVTSLSVRVVGFYGHAVYYSRFGFSIKDLVTVYVGFVRPLRQYAVPVWHPGLTQQQHDAHERIQKRACRIIIGLSYTSYQDKGVRTFAWTSPTQF